MNTVALTLREQNRQQTGAIIHDATYRLVKERGLVDTSIDDIAQKAGVSRRTFFNYYTTKESALYGLMRPVLPAEAQEAFLASNEPTLLRCAHLVLAVYRASIASGSTPERRRELQDNYPIARTKFEAQMAELEQLVEPLVVQIYDGDKKTTSLILHTAGAVLKYCRRVDPTMSEETLKSAIGTLHLITKGK